jgi:hypothetical protein
VVDLGVVKADGGGELDAVFDKEAVAADRAAAAKHSFAARRQVLDCRAEKLSLAVLTLFDRGGEPGGVVAGDERDAFVV